MVHTGPDRTAKDKTVRRRWLDSERRSLPIDFRISQSWQRSTYLRGQHSPLRGHPCQHLGVNGPTECSSKRSKQRWNDVDIGHHREVKPMAQHCWPEPRAHPRNHPLGQAPIDPLKQAITETQWTIAPAIPLMISRTTKEAKDIPINGALIETSSGVIFPRRSRRTGALLKMIRLDPLSG